MRAKRPAKALGGAADHEQIRTRTTGGFKCYLLVSMRVRRPSPACFRRGDEGVVALAGPRLGWRVTSMYRAIGRRAEPWALAGCTDWILRSQIAPVEAGIAGVAVRAGRAYSGWGADAAGEQCKRQDGACVKAEAKAEVEPLKSSEQRNFLPCTRVIVANPS